MVDATTGGQRRNLIMQLKEGSDFMENQKEELIPIWNNFEQRVCSFYETVKTPSVRMVSNPTNLCLPARNITYFL
jgi:hypothetical protein